jgi:hypothetical protein
MARITLGGELQVGRIGYGAMRLTGTNLWGALVASSQAAVSRTTRNRALPDIIRS